MLKRLPAAFVLSCIFCCASAATVSIGSVFARGGMWVDNYRVLGNATLFDGSVVQTGHATAILRLGKGAEITMASDSRAAIYRDRLLILQGETELTASPSFHIEANGLRATPGEENSRGVVSFTAENTVEVAAITGSFAVADGQGVLLASVHPGQSISFAMQANSDPSACIATGRIGLDSGNYFVTVVPTGIKYQLAGKDLAKLLGNLVGESVAIKGAIVSGAAPAGEAKAVIALQNFWSPAPGTSTGEILLLGGRQIVVGVSARGSGVTANNDPKDVAGIP
jgi:hypothetical protein